LANENQGHFSPQVFVSNPAFFSLIHIGCYFIKLLSNYCHDMLMEVIFMYDIDQKTIKEIFYKQFAELTKKTNSFDYQFSDRWVTCSKEICCNRV
jgi:hypothetical protein